LPKVPLKVLLPQLI